MEKWKTIPGYDGYEVSDGGKVRSLNYKRSGKVRELKPSIDRSGYYKVLLSKSEKSKKFHVHQLVAMAFLNHVPDGHNLVVDHIDENKLNNRLSNLRIVTHRANSSRQKRDLPTGVYLSRSGKKYRAIIDVNGKQADLGSYSTPEAASDAYQTALNKITIL